MKEAGGSPSGVERIADVWKRLRLAPMALIAAAIGRSPMALWSEATGLSPAHIATRGLRVASPARELAIERRAQSKARADLRRQGLSDPQIEDLLARRPPTPWASYVFDIGYAAESPLPLAQGCASALDDLAECCVEMLDDADLEAYRGKLGAVLRDDPDLADAAPENAEIADVRQAIDAADDWPALFAPTNRVVDYLLLRLLAALDVEWGAQYFRSLVPTPTLQWLFPRFNPDFDETNSKGLKRDVVTRPIRSVLQLMWTLLRARSSRPPTWPDRFPGPSVFASDVADVGDVSLTDAEVRQYFIGGKRLRLDDLAMLWARLSHTLMPDERIEAPWLWMVVALLMEHRFIENVPGTTRPGTVAIPSEGAYRLIWNNHRRRWAAQLPPPGERPWPAWLLDQSSSPPWLRSSQSSGRSFSPRDCQ